MFSVNASLYVPFSVAAHQSLTIFFSIIKHCFGLTSPRIVIGPEISRHLLNQSHAGLNPIAPLSLSFSRASGSLQVFTLVLLALMISTFPLVSHCYRFGSGFTALN